MTKKREEIVEILDESFEISLAEICQNYTVQAETIIEMVEEGLIEPLIEAEEHSSVHWRFHGPSVHRIEIALRLQRDLNVNLAGASLAIELLEEIDRLKQRLRIYNEEKL